MNDVTPPEPVPVHINASTVAGIVRTVRRRADLSQRELAKQIGVSQATISRIEAESAVPSLTVLLKILGAADLVLVVTDADGNVVTPMQVWDDRRDGGNCKFPAHLDLILDPAGDDWWGSMYGLARPPETYHRDRDYRDALRKRSQWEVRVAQLRNAPPPPDVDMMRRIRRLETQLKMERRMRRGRDA